jgi:hypothetical protein
MCKMAAAGGTCGWNERSHRNDLLSNLQPQDEFPESSLNLTVRTSYQGLEAASNEQLGGVKSRDKGDV